MSVWAGASSWHLELLDKLQKRCSTVVLSLAASHEPLTHHQNIASLILFYRYYFVRCSSELAQLVPLCYSRGRCTCFFVFFNFAICKAEQPLRDMELQEKAQKD